MSSQPRLIPKPGGRSQPQQNQHGFTPLPSPPAGSSAGFHMLSGIFKTPAATGTTTGNEERGGMGPKRVVFLQASPLVSEESKQAQQSRNRLPLLDSDNEQREIMNALAQGLSPSWSAVIGGSASGSVPQAATTSQPPLATSNSSSSLNLEVVVDSKQERMADEQQQQRQSQPTQPQVDREAQDLDTILFESDFCTRERFLHHVMRHDAVVIHFSGHGTADGLLFEDSSGGALLFPAGEMQDLDGPEPKLLVLNACRSASFAERLIARVGPMSLTKLAIIAVNRMEKISDTAAMLFAKHFYTMLVNGATVRAAYDAARDALRACEKTREEEQNYFLYGNENLRLFARPSSSFVTSPFLRNSSPAVSPTPSAKWTTPFKPWLPFALPAIWQPHHISMHKIIAALQNSNTQFQPIVLTGTPGLGKTTCLNSVGRYICERAHMRCHYTRVPLLTLTSITSPGLSASITGPKASVDLNQELNSCLAELPEKAKVDFRILSSALSTESFVSPDQLSDANPLGPSPTPFLTSKHESTSPAWVNFPRGGVVAIDLEQTYSDLGTILSEALREVLQKQIESINDSLSATERLESSNAHPLMHRHLKQMLTIAQVMATAHELLLKHGIAQPFARSARHDLVGMEGLGRNLLSHPGKEEDPAEAFGSNPGYLSPQYPSGSPEQTNPEQAASTLGGMSLSSKSTESHLTYDGLLQWAKRKVVNLFAETIENRQASLAGASITFPSTAHLSEALSHITRTLLAWHLLMEMRVLNCVSLHNHAVLKMRNNETAPPQIHLNFDSLWDCACLYLSNRPALLAIQHKTEANRLTAIHLRAQQQLLHLLLMDNSDAGCTMFQHALDIVDNELPAPLVRPRGRDVRRVLIQAWEDIKNEQANQSSNSNLSEPPSVAKTIRDWESGILLDRIGAHLMRNLALCTYFYSAKGISDAIREIVRMTSENKTGRCILTSLSLRSMQVRFHYGRICHAKHLFLATLADEVISAGEAMNGRNGERRPHRGQDEVLASITTMESVLCYFFKGPTCVGSTLRRSPLPSLRTVSGVSSSDTTAGSATPPTPLATISASASTSAMIISGALPEAVEEYRVQHTQSLDSCLFNTEPHVDELRKSLVVMNKTQSSVPLSTDLSIGAAATLVEEGDDDAESSSLESPNAPPSGHGYEPTAPTPTSVAAMTAAQLLDRTQKRILHACSGLCHGFGPLHFEPTAVSQLSTLPVGPTNGLTWSVVDLEPLTEHQVKKLFYYSLSQSQQQAKETILRSETSDEMRHLMNLVKGNPRAVITCARLCTASAYDLGHLTKQVNQSLQDRQSAERIISDSYQFIEQGINAIVKNITQRISDSLTIVQHHNTSPEEQKSQVPASTLEDTDFTNPALRRLGDALMRFCTDASAGSLITPQPPITAQIRAFSETPQSQSLQVPVYLLLVRVSWPLVRQVAQMAHELAGMNEKVLRNAGDEGRARLRDKLRPLSQLLAVVRSTEMQPGHIVSTDSNSSYRSQGEGALSHIIQKTSDATSSVNHQLFRNLVSTVLAMKLEGWTSNSVLTLGTRGPTLDALKNALIPLVELLRINPEVEASPRETIARSTTSAKQMQSATTLGSVQSTNTSPFSSSFMDLPNEIELSSMASKLAERLGIGIQKEAVVQKPTLLAQALSTRSVPDPTEVADTIFGNVDLMSAHELMDRLEDWFSLDPGMRRQFTRQHFEQLLKVKDMALNGVTKDHFKCSTAPNLWDAVITLSVFAEYWNEKLLHVATRKDSIALLDRTVKNDTSVAVLRMASSGGVAITRRVASDVKHYQYVVKAPNGEPMLCTPDGNANFSSLYEVLMSIRIKYLVNEDGQLIDREKLKDLQIRLRYE